MGDLDFLCDLTFIKNDVPHQLWEAISSDGQMPVLVTRFFHNKPYFYFLNFLRCYLFFLDPNFIAKIISPLVFCLLILASFILYKKGRKIFFLPFLIFPFGFVFNQWFNFNRLVVFYKIYLYLLVFIGMASWIFLGLKIKTENKKLLRSKVKR